MHNLAQECSRQTDESPHHQLELSAVNLVDASLGNSRFFAGFSALDRAESDTFDQIKRSTLLVIVKAAKRYNPPAVVTSGLLHKGTNLRAIHAQFDRAGRRQFLPPGIESLPVTKPASTRAQPRSLTVFIDAVNTHGITPFTVRAIIVPAD